MDFISCEVFFFSKNNGYSLFLFFLLVFSLVIIFFIGFLVFFMGLVILENCIWYFRYGYINMIVMRLIFGWLEYNKMKKSFIFYIFLEMEVEILKGFWYVYICCE